MVDDNQLMKRIAREERQALNILYNRYGVALYNFLSRYTGRRELAQDLLQETFIRVWRSAHTYRFKAGSCSAWLYAIARNLARSELVKKQYSIATVAVEDAGLTSEERPDLQAEEGDQREQIRSALQTLSPELREVIVMKHYQYLKFREMAGITGIPEGTLKARYHRAVDKLRKHFIQEDKGCSM